MRHPKLPFCWLLTAGALSLVCACSGSHENAVAGAGAVSTSGNSLDGVTFNLSRSVLDTKDVPFASQGSWVGLNVQTDPVAALHVQLEQALGRSLNGRGDAHVTVISPPEASQLRDFVSISRMEQIANELNIQDANLDVICLGIGESNRDASKTTYYVVVHSEKLLEIRRQITQEYEQASNGAAPFDPEHFFPHITVAFTKTDLFEGELVQDKAPPSCPGYPASNLALTD